MQKTMTEEIRAHTASKNPRSNILLDVSSTLPVRKRS